MTIPNVIFHDAQTGEVIERKMNAEELAQWEADKAAAQAEAETKALQEQARQVILDRLGLTADEAALLLGAK